jgi:hypothetical protein
MLEIERWFSYFPSVVPKSLKSHHASDDGYHTLKASSTFRSNNFPPFFTSGFRMSDVIDHIVHKSRTAKRRNRFKVLPRSVTRVKFS